MRDPFYRLYEAPEDQGGAALEDPPETDDDLLEEEAPEPPRYTMEELAEHLGPTFQERFAPHHEGPDALRKFGESFQNAQKVISRGGKLEPEDAQLLESLGIQVPEPEPEVEYREPIYGVPWADPTSWDELVDLANRNPRAAAEFAMKQDDFPDETKAWFFANWASVDAAGVFAYNQAATAAAARAYADEQTAALRSQVEPLVQDRMTRNANLMVDQARSSIPGFAENAAAGSKLMEERQARDPRYHEWFLNTTLDAQLQELRDLTGIAIFRAQPAAEQQAQDDLAAAEADKARAKTETSRTGGSRAPATQQSQMKKNNLEQFKKLKEQGLI